MWGNAGYAAKLRQLPGLLAAAAVPAWKVAAAVAACLALAYTAVYVTQVEKRLPLVYYKRRAQVSSGSMGRHWLPDHPLQERYFRAMLS